MKILKFGGTSVGSVERIKAVKELIVNEEPKIVVLSAMSGTTNALVAIGETLYANEADKAKTLIAELEEKYRTVVGELYEKSDTKHKANRLIDNQFDVIRGLSEYLFNERKERRLLAQGEILSTHLVQYYLEEIGVESVLLDALDFMRIDINDEPDLQHLTAKLTPILKQFSSRKLFITQGYICLNSFGEVDNLKRGGSDYTASLIGAGIQADEIQIWTDIDGMHNNDPRFVDKTRPIAELSFDEAAELAYFGAKILHPACVKPAQLKNIPVRILNTMKPHLQGTLITSNVSGREVKAIAAKDNIVAIKIKSGRMLMAYGFLRKLFEIFEKYKKSVDTVTTSEVAVSVTIDDDTNLEKIIAELQEFSTVEVDRGLSTICIVGDLMEDTYGYARKIFAPFEDIPIRMISYGGSKNNVTMLVKTEYKQAVLKLLNKSLFNL